MPWQRIQSKFSVEKKKQKHLNRKYLCRQSELLFRLWEAHFFAANIKKRMLLNAPELHNVPSPPPSGSPVLTTCKAIIKVFVSGFDYSACSDLINLTNVLIICKTRHYRTFFYFSWRMLPEV